jgi:hypothetical protein
MNLRENQQEVVKCHEVEAHLNKYEHSCENFYTLLYSRAEQRSRTVYSTCNFPPIKQFVPLIAVREGSAMCDTKKQ